MKNEKIEKIFLDGLTLKEKQNGYPYTKKTINEIVILIAGHNNTEPDGGDTV